MQSDVYIQFRSEHSAVMQMKNFRLAASHAQNGPTQEELPEMDALEKREISSEYKKILELPVAFNYQDGLVSELQFTEEGEKAWSANIKRAVLNMIQMNKNVPEENNNEFYTAIEKTLEGECEISYSVVAEKEETVVSKSVNFEKCSHNSESVYGRRFAKRSEQNKIMSPQTLYTFKVVKDEVKEVVARSTYTVRVMEEPVMQTQVEARLTLAEVSEPRNKIEVPSGETKDIMYSNEWELAVEKFFKGGEKYVKNPFEEFTTKIERASEIIETVKEKKESDPEMVHSMARLVRIFRMCSLEELTQIHDKLFKDAHQNVKNIVEHALAIAGTRNTVEHLLRHIKDQEITLVKATQLFKSIQETHYPSEQIAKLIEEFARSEIARSEPVLRQSAWLCYGAVVRGIVDHREEIHLFEEDTTELKKKFLTILEENFEDAKNVYQKVLALKTIANSGLDIAVHTLERIIYNREESSIIRVEAIQALRIMAQQMPRKIQRVLMPIFGDYKEKPEVRAAAFERLIYTLPNMSVLSQIVNIYERDPNHHVAHFAYSFMEGIGKTNFATEKRMISDVQSVLKRSSFTPKSTWYSFYKHFPYYSQQWVSGAHINVASILGKDSILPKGMNVDFEAITLGRWNQYLAQMGVSHQNIEQIVRKVYTQLSKQSPMLRGERTQKRVEEGMNLVKKIAKEMNIRLRQERTTETPFAMIYLRYKDMDYAVLPIDEEIVNSFIERYLRHGKIDSELLEKMLNGNIEFNTNVAGFLFETTHRVPTTLGLPISLTSKMPTIATTHGKAVIEKVNYGARVRLQGKPAVTSTQVFQMRCWTPLFEHGVKNVRPVKVVLPLDMDVEMTYKEKLTVSLRVATPEKKQPIVEISAAPIAFLRFPSSRDMNKFVEIEENTIVIPGWHKKMRSVEEKYEFGGVIFRRNGHGYKQWSPKEYFFGEHNYHLSVESSDRAPKEWTMNLETNWFSDVNMEKPTVYASEEPKIHGEEAARQLVSELSREIKKGWSIEFNGNIQTTERTTFSVVAKRDNSLRYYRWNSAVNVPFRGGDWTWEQKIEAFMPRPVQTMEQLLEKEGQAYIVAMNKWGTSGKNELLTKIIMEQSPEMSHWIRAVKKEMTGMEEYEQLLKTSVLNKIRIASKYSLSQESEKYFDKAFEALRAYGFWSSKVERHQGKKNYFRAEVVIEPATCRYANLTLESPRLRLSENMWTPVRVPLIPRAQLPWSVTKNMVTKNSECRVWQNNKISTFDEVVYRAPLTKCWTVLAKDCSEEARYAVLVKKTNDDKKTIKLVKEDKEFVVELVRNKIRVSHNKKEVSEENYDEYNIELLNPKMVVINLEQVIVRFDGESVKVESTIAQMNNQCGLCGHYNGDKSEIFRSANGESTEDMEEFHRSYLLKDEECEIEEQKVSQKSQYKIYSDESENKEYRNEESYDEMPQKPKKTNFKKYENEDDYDVQKKTIKKQERKYQQNEEYDQEEERSQEYDSDMDQRKPEQKNKILERSNSICISLEPLPECPKNFRNSEEKKQKAKMVCLSRHQPETSRLLREIRNEPREITNEYLRSLDSSKVTIEQLSLPKMCVAY
jgi:hypothetical protein